MGNNHVQVSQGFRILLGAFAPYVTRELENEFGSNWWSDGVLDKLYDDQKRDLPNSGDNAKLVAFSTFKFVSYSLLMFIGRVYSERSSPSTTVPGQ